MTDGVVIVGGSVAGARTARSLRQFGYAGPIRVVEAQPHPPYDKPPLSKASLEVDTDPQVPLLTLTQAEELGVELMLGVAGAFLDPRARKLGLSDGTDLRYDHLVIATGAAARRSPWGVVPRLRHLRSLDDAVQLRDDLDRSDSVLVIGAGFIGSEFASVARRRGLRVTMVDPLSVPMARLVGPRLGERLANLHRDHDVDTRFGVGVVSVEAVDDGVRARLSDDTTVEAGFAVVGIGVELNVSWLAGSGLVLDDGVVADEFSRAVGHEDVYVAGDVARWFHRRHGRLHRVEHWTNAIEQADQIARNIAHPEDAKAFAPVEYVWSDQYDWKIQLAGLPDPDAEPTVIETTDPLRLAAFWSAPNGELTGVLTVNWAKASLTTRRALASGGTLAGVLKDLNLTAAGIT